MKSKLIATALVAAAALTSFGASAQVFNPWLFDQMAAPATKTRAEVKAEVLQAAQGKVSPSSYNGATAQQNLSPAAEKTGGQPQADAGFVKTSQ